MAVLRKSTDAAVASYNTGFPKLEDDECGWDASGIPERYRKDEKQGCRYPGVKNLGVILYGQ